MTPRSIAHVASEFAPLAKVGGLADMVGSLSAEQARRGHRVAVALPMYRDLHLPAGWTRRAFANCDVPWGLGREPAHFDLVEPPSGRPIVLLVGHEGERRFFDRPGIYDDPRTGEGYPDNAERFLFFSRAAMEGLKRLGERFDVLHAHDQQAAWVPCFARTHEAYEPAFGGVATVFTIHNLGYQGIVDPWILGVAGFGGELFYPASPFEYWGRVNVMKVGLAFCDLITTVSPRYAQEIRSSGEFGFGLEGLLQHRADALRGILNGIDDTVWDPSRDPYLVAHYGPADLAGKAANRAALIAECGFPIEPDAPLVGMVGRLVEQKGLDLVEQAGDDLFRLDARFVVLGSGPPRYEGLVRRLAQHHPGRMYHRAGHDERFAHLIEAGADVFLMPSRYEPCGLNQMYSLRYGTVPVVRAVGGLADSVEEFDPMTGRGTGFLFQRFDAADMLAALRKAIAMWRQPTLWRRLQVNGMAVDFSWRASADAYDAAYEETLARVARDGAPTLETVRALTRMEAR
uniref:Glycogen synthase n=1 Tax=Eiseniibacteriota bacterium TaxID=2212470 RepID=A0A832I261_UNCEI